MRAETASDANAGENPFYDRSQHSAKVADLTREIKRHAMLQPLRRPQSPTGLQPTYMLAMADAQGHS